MTIKPLFDKVVLKAAEVEETTKSGILLAGSAKEKPQMAEIVAVGPGGMVDGKEVKVRICKKCGAVLEFKAEEAKVAKKKTVRKKSAKKAEENTEVAENAENAEVVEATEEAPKKKTVRKKTVKTEEAPATEEVKTEAKKTVRKKSAKTADETSNA